MDRIGKEQTFGRAYGGNRGVNNAPQLGQAGRPVTCTALQRHAGVRHMATGVVAKMAALADRNWGSGCLFVCGVCVVEGWGEEEGGLN